MKNEASFKAAGKLVKQYHPNIVWTLGCAHCIDLMLEDISKMSEMKEIIVEAKAITSFLCNYEKITALVRKFTQCHELLKLNVTRFATEFVTLECIVRVWIESGYADQYPMSQVLLKIVINQNFWRKAEKICCLLKALKFVDGKTTRSLKFMMALIRPNLVQEWGKKSRELLQPMKSD